MALEADYRFTHSNRYIGKILSTDPILGGNASVRGEISNLKYHWILGHVYFSLKGCGQQNQLFSSWLLPPEISVIS